jgi:hypothetical protein
MALDYERDANGGHKVAMLTIREAAQMALDVQTACNLSGVVRSFVRVIDAIRNHPNVGTVSVNTHAICQLFASKIEDLTQVNYGLAGNLSAAYATCTRIAAGEPIPPSPPRYVNAYDTNQAYGGPEEGGWWFDTGEPLASVPVYTDEEADAAREQLRARFAPQFDGNHPIDSVLCEGALAIYVESEPAKPFPSTRPHYE